MFAKFAVQGTAGHGHAIAKAIRIQVGIIQAGFYHFSYFHDKRMIKSTDCHLSFRVGQKNKGHNSGFWG